MNGDIDLLAVDLRGRGRSWTQPGPVGLRQHADDVAAVIEQLGGPVVVVGHSMGTYVALLLAERHPAAVRSLVLVDGGTALYLPDPPVRDDGTVTPKDEFIDEVLDVSLGPVIERLGKVWPDRASYRGDVGAAPGVRRRHRPGTRAHPARRPHRDRRWLPGDGRPGRDPAQRAGSCSPTTRCARRSTVIRSRPRIIRAEFGLMGTPPPLIADDMIDRYPQHRWIRADGLNHYTVMNSASGATIVADEIRHAVRAV